jgi:hypothetical protein
MYVCMYVCMYVLIACRSHYFQTKMFNPYEIRLVTCLDQWPFNVHWHMAGESIYAAQVMSVPILCDPYLVVLMVLNAYSLVLAQDMQHTSQRLPEWGAPCNEIKAGECANRLDTSCHHCRKLPGKLSWDWGATCKHWISGMNPFILFELC